MKEGKGLKRGRKKGHVLSKVPQIEFDMEAIKEIKNRRKGKKKEGVKRWSQMKRSEG